MTMVRDNTAAYEESSQWHPTTVACLGSSSTAGKGQAFDWIGELRKRPRNRSYDFRNFGTGGDLAYNALQRLDGVLTSRPEIAIVWIGANDVLAMTFPNFNRFVRRWKRLPEKPSAELFRRSLQVITHRLKTETSAHIGLCSLSPIGEDLLSTDPFQSALNCHVRDFSAIIRDWAREEGVNYIPVYETMVANMQNSPRHAFTSLRFLPFYRDALRVLALRKSPDEVARMNDWQFHTDGVHMNSRSGMIVANLVQEFIDSP
jgi:lysophospholipase L1-like esterase